ncbi:TPA: hydrolase [Legionella pneumophila]|uniref:hydrolase n=1 Tax=Legionella pneumophila TaxID=446 RepID=UPI0009B58F14|nr:hydrolase [Legionella pneumophila]MDW8879051.1 hydrolase [Legionella pneumophila subsp. fraseri]MDW8961530.1 hydrolase [Legionella pneumophila subsp. fraseri]MDW9036193.1 hydrolase [Legionella pneumophila subsp. fraseri]MDW9039050.1 hydrolase [Legionella pneumophila subsp. fraseri]MDW9041898.1 hydrolase [Legionella pneumophila subsp. fraseri]
MRSCPMPKPPNKMKEELEQIRKTEIENAMAKEREELLAKRSRERAEAEDNLKKGRYIKDPRTGQTTTLWENAIQKADEVLNADLNAYMDARAAIMSLLKMYYEMVKANAQTMKELRAGIGNTIMDWGIFPIKDYIGKKLTGDPEIDLPILQHEVSYTDDNKLKIEPLTRSDKGEEKGKLDQLFEGMVHMWLKNNDYTPDPNNPGQFVNSHGEALDKATFDKLKKDDQHGLNHFLTEYDPDLQYRPSRP